MNHRNILTAAVLAASLGVAHASIFNPVGPQIREANNNWSLAFINQTINYKEVPPIPLLPNPQPNPLDTETGSVRGIHWDVRHQHAYLGWGLGINYLQSKGFGGNVTYNGYFVQNNDTLTPASGPTEIGQISGHLFVRGGFSPVTHMALFFGPIVGGHMWARNNASWAGGTWEDYSFLYAGGDASLQYAIGPVVFGVSGVVGRTFVSSMNTGNITYHLGNSPFQRIGGRVTYNATKHLSVYVDYSRTTYSFGVSPVVTSGVTQSVEPTSHTTLSAVELGVRIHNFF